MPAPCCGAAVLQHKFVSICRRVLEGGSLSLSFTTNVVSLVLQRTPPPSVRLPPHPFSSAFPFVHCTRPCKRTRATSSSTSASWWTRMWYARLPPPFAFANQHRTLAMPLVGGMQLDRTPPRNLLDSNSVPSRLPLPSTPACACAGEGGEGAVIHFPPTEPWAPIGQIECDVAFNKLRSHPPENEWQKVRVRVQGACDCALVAPPPDAWAHRLHRCAS
jgi:hypothetical protein